jgi:hypothetical protein
MATLAGDLNQAVARFRLDAESQGAVQYLSSAADSETPAAPLLPA